MDSCRTCLREAIADRGYGIFDPDVRPVTDLLMASTSLRISENDGLPSRICIDCFAQLSGFQAFCRLAIESDLIYRKNHHIKVELGDEGTETTTNHIDIPAERPAAVSADKRSASIKSESKWGPSDDDCDDRAEDDDDAAEDNSDDNQAADERHPYAPNVSTESKKKESIPNMSHPMQKGGPRKRPFAPRPGARCVDKSNKYTCDECGKFYYEKDRLAGHLRQHYGLRAFPCDRCPSQYDKYSKLRAHQQKHAPPPPDQPTVCPHEGCGKTYRLPRFAQDHYERIHLGLRKKVRAMCVCDACGKSFMTRSSLLQHSKSHMGIDQYPYQCDVCGKRFLAKNNHMLHMLRHNNIRNFPCTLCPSRMVSQLELKNHMAKTHKDNRMARTSKRKMQKEKGKDE